MLDSRGLWIGGAIGAWIACGALYLTLPPNGDQFVLGYAGWRTLAGDVPYVDFVDMNWPLVYWLHAASVALFGTELWSWRAFDLLLLLLATPVTADLAKRAGGPLAARFVWIWLPLFYVGLNNRSSGQPDVAAGELALASIWLHVRSVERGDLRWQLGAGAALGAAMLCKPTIAVLAPLAALQLLWLRMPLGRALAHALSAGAGTLAVLGVAVAALLLQGASLGAIADSTLVYNAETQFDEAVGLGPLARTWAVLHLDSWWMLTALGAFGWAWTWRASPRAAVAGALPLVWIAGVLSFALQRRGFLYHLGPCLIPLVALAAVFAGKALAPELRSSRVARVAGAVALALVLAGGVVKLRANYWSLVPALRSGDYAIHLRGFKRQDGLALDEVVALAQRIEREVPPDGKVLMIGTTSAVNFLTKRAQPSRFFYSPVLFHVRPDMPMHDAWVASFTRDLERTPPQICLISRRARERWLARGGASARVLRDALARSYVQTGTFGEHHAFEIYEPR
jgi:hypothetical protein